MKDPNGLKVLLIDDTRIVLEHLVSLLSALKQVGHTRAVLSAEEGLVLLDEFEPDIMVLDINMPGMNGIEMLRKMTVHHKTQRPVVIMLTNNTFAGYRDECMRLGADYFLDKSRDFQMIPQIIEQIRQGRAAVHL